MANKIRCLQKFFIKFGDRFSLRAGLLKNGDLVVMTASVPPGVSDTTNLMKAHIVGDVLVTGCGVGSGAVTKYNFFGFFKKSVKMLKFYH